MVTSLTGQYLDAFTYELQFTSDQPSPTFWIYRDGQFLYTTTQTSAIFQLLAGDSPVFEVLDDATNPTPAYPSTVTLAWYAAAGATSYRIDQQEGSNWIALVTVTDDGAGYFVWQSDTQPDGQNATFRVVPTGIAGNDGTPATFAVLIVRFPDAPAASMTYSAASGLVTISD